MPRPKSNEPPKYRHHKARNLAVVTINSQDHYLGEYGSPESREKYAVLIAQHARSHSKCKPESDAEKETVIAATPLRVADLTLRYNKHAEAYYVKNDQITHQVNRIKMALRAVNALYSATRADEFGPKKLKLVREYLLGRQDLRFKEERQSLSRTYINALVQCVVRMFKWGVAEELIPASVYEALATVEGLKKGRVDARETEPVQPVCDEHINAVLEHAGPQVAAMIKLQRVSGMRPCEVRVIRPADITMRMDGIWIYRPQINKNEHHDQDRIVCLGPRGQEILRPWLQRPAESYCFSPREAVEAKRREMRAKRKTPVQPSQRNRSKPTAKVRPGDCYSRNAYRQAIQRACAESKVPKWSPNQLRHLWATEVRAKYGLEASQVTLGHTKADTTEHYAQRDLELAARVAREAG
jgi:integrase